MFSLSPERINPRILLQKYTFDCVIGRLSFVHNKIKVKTRKALQFPMPRSREKFKMSGLVQPSAPPKKQNPYEVVMSVNSADRNPQKGEEGDGGKYHYYTTIRDDSPEKDEEEEKTANNKTNLRLLKLEHSAEVSAQKLAAMEENRENGGGYKRDSTKSKTCCVCSIIWLYIVIVAVIVYLFIHR